MIYPDYNLVRELKEQFAKEKKNFEEDKKHQEKMLRDMFKVEMDAMKSKLENDFSSQKKTMIREFNDRLEKDKLEMKSAHEREISVKEELLKKEIETLKKEFDLKKRELEAELGTAQSRTSETYKAYQKCERRLKELQFQQDEEKKNQSR